MPMVQVKELEQSLSVIFFKQSPFFGSYHFSTRGLRQQSTSNFTLYVARRDFNSTLIKQAFDLTFSNYTFAKSQLNETYERQITHCAGLPTQRNIMDTQFNFSHCSTNYDYERGVVFCKCSGSEFFTVTRDEFEIPLSDDMSFNFQNWASLIAFTYLTVVLLIGVTIAQNLDQKDITKLNDIEGDDG